MGIVGRGAKSTAVVVVVEGFGFGFGFGFLGLGGARDREVVFFERDDYGDELGEKVGENETKDYGLDELLPISHGCTENSISVKKTLVVRNGGFQNPRNGTYVRERERES